MSGLWSWRGHAYLALVARWYLAFVFLAAAWHKIVDPASFALDIATYEMVPLWGINLMAMTLPWLEVTAALMMLAGFRVRAASWLMGGMLVAFIIALSWALAAGIDTSCGCFASTAEGADPISWRTIARDVGWLGLTLYIWGLDASPIGIDRWQKLRSANA